MRKIQVESHGWKDHNTPRVLHNLGLTRNLIFVRKMENAEVKIMFERETYRMV
jgi:hypothetical protein